jgi:hypothetical protein
MRAACRKSRIASESAKANALASAGGAAPWK